MLSRTRYFVDGLATGEEDPAVRRLRLQYEVASLLACARSPQEGLAKALGKIAYSEKWDLGIVWLRKDGRWHCEYVWHRPGLSTTSFLRENQRATSQDLPLLQDVAQACLLTRFNDLSQQPCTEHVLGAGLSRAVSIPLDCKGTFYGVIELFGTGVDSGSDSPELLTLLGSDIGQYLHARHFALGILGSGHRWEAIFRNSPVPSLIMEVNTGRCVAANDEMLMLLDLSYDDVIGRSAIDLKLWSDPGQREDIARMLKEYGSLRQYEFSTELNGEERFILCDMEEAELNGQMCQLIQLTDITPRKRSEEKLRLAAAAVEHAGEGLILLSANGKIISVNPAFTHITGYEQPQACGMALDELLHRPTNRHDELFFRRIAGDLTMQGRWEGQAWARRKNGSDFPASLTLNAIRDNDARLTNYVVVFSDISKQREYESRLEQLALYDGLTGLANRTLFKKRADQAISQAERHGRPLAILFADLDRFKDVNDLYGHAVGDELLKWVAQRLVSCVRAGDTIARLGGDEFVVLLPEMKEPDHAALVAEKITKSFKEPFVVGTQLLSIGATVGIARYPLNGHDMPALLRHADEDLYCRKPIR